MSISRAIAKLSKQLAENRGLKGNRNKDGDFMSYDEMTTDEMMAGVKTEISYTPTGTMRFEHLNSKDFEEKLLQNPEDKQTIKQDLIEAQRELREILEDDRNGIEQAPPGTLEELSDIEEALDIIERLEFSN
jgi:hypothetical protein